MKIDRTHIALTLAIVLLIGAIAYLLYDKQPGITDPVLTKEKENLQIHKLKSDSIGNLVSLKDKELAVQQIFIDSIQKEYEKQNTKPQPEHLRNATVMELDSFWSSY